MNPRRISIDPALLVTIAGDAAMAGPVADGRLVPVLILDTGNRSDVAEIIRLHQHFPEGGAARSQWASWRDDDEVVLLDIQFAAPAETRIVIPFSIEEQGILVDLVLASGAVYLQAGKPGDGLMETMGAPRVLVEVPETGFRAEWEGLFLARMTDVIARRLGVRRRQARPHAKELIAQLRAVTGLRMPQ